MRDRIKYILLLILLLTVQWAAIGADAIDKVCQDAIRTYRVNGDPYLTYSWELTDSGGNVLTVSAGTNFSGNDIYGNPIVGSELLITWNYSPGLYTLTVKKQNQYSCKIETLGIIEVVPNPTVFAGDDLVVCKGSAAQLDKATATNYSKIAWTTKGDGIFDNPNALNPVYTPGAGDIATGSVVLSITADGLGDGSSCIPVTDEIVLDIINITASAYATNITCFGKNNGVITVNDDGLAAYQYNVQRIGQPESWTSSYYRENLVPGKYLVQIKNPIFDCAVTIGNYEIIEPPEIIPAVNIDNPSCFDGKGAITISVKGGWGSYLFSVNNGPWQNSGYYPNLPAGDYDVRVKDAAFDDCIVVVGNVEINPLPELLATPIPTAATCYGSASGKITLTNVSGGSGNFEFSKDGVNWQTSYIFNNLVAGDYPISMRDADHIECKKFLDIITVLEPEAIVATLTPIPASCFGVADGKIQVWDPLNGTPPYEYSVDGVKWYTDGLLTGLAGSMSYTVRVRDAKLCQSTMAPVKVDQPDKLDFNALPTDETVADAKDGTINIVDRQGGSKVYEYKFGTLDWQDVPQISNLAPDTYTVYMRDKLAPNCEIPKQVTIYPAGAVSAQFTSKNITCYGGSDGEITFTNLSGASNYDFSIDDGVTWRPDNNVFTGLSAGILYVLKVRDQANPLNAKQIGQVELSQPNEISATVVAGSESAAGANDGKLTISNVTGGSNSGYKWCLDNVSWDSKTVYSGLASGTYTVYIKDSNDCPGQVSRTVPILGQLIAEVTHTNLSCSVANDPGASGSITISNLSGASLYDYNIGAGWVSVPGTSVTISGLAAKSTPYTVMIRDRSNPLNVVTLIPQTITSPSKLTGRSSIDSEPLCAGASGIVSIFATGGTGNKKFTNALNGTPINNLLPFTMAAGEKMKVRVTDDNGCNDDFDIQMPNPVPLVVTSFIKEPKCFGESSGTIEISASGGTGDLFVNGVKMTDGKMIFTVLAGRQYNYVVTDSNGCPSTPIKGTMPNAPTQLAVSFTGLKDVSCFGGTDGEVTATASGGTPPYRYLWSDPAKQTTQTAIGLRKGTYTVTVTDSNNCSKDFQVTINEMPAAEEPMATDVQPDCDVLFGSIIITQPVPSVGVSYTLTGINPIVAPVTNLSGVFPNLDSGEYEYTVTNALGCTSSPKPIKINSHPVTPPNPTALPVSPVCEDVPIQTLNANNYIVAPTGGVVIVWYDAPVGGNVVAQPILNTAQTVTYYAEATNGHCSSPGRTSVSLTIIPRPSSPISKGDLSACESTPMVKLDARDAIDPASIIDVRWFTVPTGGTEIANPTLNTVNSITYYAENNGGTCSSSPRIPVRLTIYPNPSAPVLNLTEIPKCSDSFGIVNVTSPVGPEYVYSVYRADDVDNGNYTSTAIFNLLPGSYKVKAKNSITGCISPETSITIPPIPPQPHITNLTVENCICYGDSGKLNFDFANVVNGTYVIVYVGGQFNNVKVFNGKATIKAPGGKTYNVLAIEANGCTSPETKWSTTIEQPPKLSVSAKITEIDLKSGQKGEIDLTISGGTGKYLTTWDPNIPSGFAGATSEDIKDLSNGDYIVTIVDNNGCQLKDTLTIPLPNLPPIATNDEFDANCNSLTGDLLFTDNGSGIDSDPDNDPIEIDVTPLKLPKYGSLTINPDGTFVYKAVRGYVGDDTFSYQIFDIKKNNSIPAVVTIHIAADSDGDGLVDNIDPDADGDGILNVNEVLSGQDWKTTDSDGDGNANYLDIDSDGDGILDNIEAQPSLGYLNPDGIDTDNDGVDDAYDPDNGGTTLIPVNTDLTSSTGGDDLPDFMDSDSDDDLVPDYIEGHDTNSDGKPDIVMGGKDFDGDGLDDIYDTMANDCSIENAFAGNAAIQDFDMDGQRDWRDENDDDDEYLTRFEDLNMDGDFSNDDTDFDGHPEYLDYGRDCDLFVPDAFSPNNDNIHDYFMVYCINHFPNAQMFIFDQNGNKLYEKNNYGNLAVWGTPDRAWWDGRTTFKGIVTNGGKVLPGTYYYVLKLGNGDVKKSFVFVSY